MRYKKRAKKYEGGTITNKIIPHKYEKIVLQCLKKYPELAHTRIRVVEQISYLPLASRPNRITVLRKKTEREYLIIIARKTQKMFGPMKYENLTQKAQIGIMGHELAHTLHYTQLHLVSIVGITLMFPLPIFRRWFEQETDRRAIRYGFGKYLLEHATFVRQFVSEKTLNRMDLYYLQPHEMIQYMKEIK